MTDIVKDLIKFHETEIEHDMWDVLYTVFNSDGPNQLNYQYIGEFTEVMLGADICPTDYLDYIPEGYLYGTNVPKVDIPTDIKTIKTFAYGGCQKLTSVIIPESVQEIEANAFAYCDNLEEVTIMNPWTKIDIFSFYSTTPKVVNYSGTKGMWKTQNYNIAATKVICDDGEL